MGGRQAHGFQRQSHSNMLAQRCLRGIISQGPWVGYSRRGMVLMTRLGNAFSSYVLSACYATSIILGPAGTVEEHGNKQKHRHPGK